MKYFKSLLALFAAEFGPQKPDEDSIWNDWVLLDKPEPSRLQELIYKTSVRAEFKARAVAILIAPDLQLIPWWKFDSNGLKNFLARNNLIDFEPLSPRLRDLVGELICLNCNYAQEHVSGETNGTNEMKDAVIAYNNLILKVLPFIADDDLAERLFAQYQINDPFPYWDMNTASGYNPLYALLTSEKLSLEWKQRADQQMRDRIIEELVGRAIPRTEYEDALTCYANHLGSAIFKGELQYENSLYVSQIEFLMSRPIIAMSKKRLFNPWNLTFIFNAIAGEGYKELRHRLARQVVIFSEFSVYDEKSREAADLMLAEFGESDHALRQRLQSAIDVADKREKSSKRKQDDENQKKEHVLRQMS